MKRDLITKTLVRYKSGGRYATRPIYDRTFSNRAVTGFRSPDLGVIKLGMKYWQEQEWIPDVPGLQCFACPYCLLYQAQVIWGYRGQLERLTSG